MISSLLLVLGAGSAMAGFSIQMPYPNPAGITYTAQAAAVPAVPAHLQYAATSSSVAYGNGAFLGRTLAPAAVQYAAPVAQYAAAPVAHYAAPVVPTVHHVPAIAQVPVTKYEAQPAVIQNLVDVARPKLASRKIEIRRPAIQKEFYDVEERVIIRPAGSAVVELDQPVSKNQRGPTLVQPAVHAVSAHPLVGLRSLHSHAISGAYPASFSVHQYPLQGPAAIPVASSPIPHQEHEQQPQEYPQEPQQEQQLPQQELQQLPQQELQQLPQQELQQASQQEIPQAPQQELQQFPQQEPQQFDDSDSVAIDNPDIARLRSQQRPELSAQQPQQQPQQQLQQQPQQQQLFRNFPQRPSLFAPQEQLLSQLREMVQQRASNQQQLIARSQLQAQESVVAQLEAQTQAQQDQLSRTQQILQIQQQELARSRASASLARSQPEPQQPAPAARAQQNAPETGLQSVGPDPQQRTAAAASLSSSDLRNSLIDSVARSSPSPNVIPSFRISAEQSLSNQARFIDLLTGRGGVVEARNANGQPSSEPSQVRARVLSVTPAPDNAAPREEKVNTRRIVVSRPIQTLEEVDVVQPFTKIERVAVHSPAVLKTAHHGVAHLPTSLPVHGYAAAIPAYK